MWFHVGFPILVIWAHCDINACFSIVLTMRDVPFFCFWTFSKFYWRFWKFSLSSSKYIFWGLSKGGGRKYSHALKAKCHVSYKLCSGPSYGFRARSTLEMATTDNVFAGFTSGVCFGSLAKGSGVTISLLFSKICSIATVAKNMWGPKTIEIITSVNKTAFWRGC